MITKQSPSQFYPEFPIHETAVEFIEKPQESIEQHLWRRVCGYELAAIIRRKASQEDAAETVKNQKHMITTLLSALAPGQRAIFEYGGGKGRPFGMRVFGEMETSNEGEHLNLQEMVAASLNFGSAEYRFRKLGDFSDANSGEPMIHHVDIRPEGFTLRRSTSPVGFEEKQQSEVMAEAVVHLPEYLDAQRVSIPLVKLIQSAVHPLQLLITLEPIRLSPTDVVCLEQALKGGRSSHGSGYWSESLEGAASLWIRERQGFRLGCRIRSSLPVSVAFLNLLAREIFPVSNRVTFNVNSTDNEAVGATIDAKMDLDLSSCVPVSMSAPMLFPVPSDMSQHGVRGFYNPKVPTLPGNGILLGSISEHQESQEVRIGMAERNRHVYILGATGAGKSTLLFNSVMQDILNGEGVCLIDPHGDLYRDVLEAIPKNRARDVILFDPCNRESAPGLNLLECTGPFRDAQVNFVINEMCALLEKIYNMEVCGGPMFEQYFRSALQLVMSNPDKPSTLIDLSAVFEHRAYRESLINACGNPLLADFWGMAERVTGEPQLSNIAPYIVSKLNMFVHNALLRPIVGQTRSTIDFRQVMDKRKILLVNLARGALGEIDLKLLGMVLLTKLVCAAMTRMDLPPAKRTPFMVYVDEFQNFTTDASASLLSESRKFGLCLTLAHQNLSQLSVGKENDMVMQSLLGNVGSTVFFRLGAPDAEKLAIYAQPEFGREDLQSLPNYHAAARVLGADGPSLPFVFKTHPPMAAKQTRVAAQIRRNQIRYSTPIIEVEKAIIERRECIKRMSSPRPKPE